MIEGNDISEIDHVAPELKDFKKPWRNVKSTISRAFMTGEDETKGEF